MSTPKTTPVVAPQHTPSVYASLAKVDNVLVAIPRMINNDDLRAHNGQMKEVAAHSFLAGAGEVQVPKHHQDAIMINNKVVNRHYFGFNREQLGAKCVCTVELVLKQKDGRQFMIINITATPSSPAELTLKYPEKGTYAIPGTKFGVSFVERQQKTQFN